MNKSDIYDALVLLGEMSGCHRMPERSFFVHGKQFPVCARCTGAFIGYFVGFVCFFFYRLHPLICILLCGIMFLDWLIQRIGVCESTNVRRVITGALCGFGLRQLTFEAYIFVIRFVVRCFS